MAKKEKTKKEVKDVDIDALVNEAQNIDVKEVDKIIEENKDVEEPKPVEEIKEVEPKVEEKVEEVVEEPKEVVTDDVNETVEEEKVVAEEEVEESNIDDLIEECTSSVEPKEPKKEKPVQEPWYVIRAKGLNDYYNW